jgi:hypothetical protein
VLGQFLFFGSESKIKDEMAQEKLNKKTEEKDIGKHK